MKRLLLVVAVAVAGCNDTIPGECKSTSDCPPGDECFSGFCSPTQNADAGTVDSGVVDAADAGSSDAGSVRDGGSDASAPAPGGKWEAATSAGAFGDKTLVNSKYKVTGSLGEPTPAVEGGLVEMRSTSYRCISGFNAALHSN